MRHGTKRPVEGIGTFIEQGEECFCGFLRGFFDSEGNIYERNLTASNGDPALLNLVCRCMRILHIEFTGPHYVRKEGRKVMIQGRLWTQNLDQYYIYVRTRSLASFQAKVGFSIQRKSQGLAQALSRSEAIERF